MRCWKCKGELKKITIASYSYQTVSVDKNGKNLGDYTTPEVGSTIDAFCPFCDAVLNVDSSDNLIKGE